MRWKAALCSWQLGTAAFCSGKALLMPEGSRYPVLGCLTIRAKETGNVFISDVLAHPVFAPETASYGFINRTAHIHGNDRDPLFTVVKGAGDGETAGESHEGNLYRNFLGPGSLDLSWSRTPRF